MAEETLKANEFEHGIDEPYNAHKSFQQLYGPETNYSYRADSAEEVLGVAPFVGAWIEMMSR